MFWDAYRAAWRRRLALWKTGRGEFAWTEDIKRTAENACKDFARRIGIAVRIGREEFGRLDVHASHSTTDELIVAFENEGAYWGCKGDWSAEFRKLCGVSAQLRVLSSTFKPRTGADFPTFLARCLNSNSMRTHFQNGSHGDFCLIFGPADTIKDSEQPWLAFALEADLGLRELISYKPLKPRHIIGIYRDSFD